MRNSLINIHATAIVLGRQGFLIVGPSGSGKSRLARTLLNDGLRNNMFAALISDDQVWIEAHHGKIVAHRAETIRDMLEIRFSGIARVESVCAAVMDAVLVPISARDTPDRLPQSNETMEVAPGMTLPVVRLCHDLNPDMAMLQTLMPGRKTCAKAPSAH
ncbi:serine kinase of HPr protein (carbohydrate metabolism regulator) [Agrobacterium vitis]|nr:serine kinase of HPr protein (carbohydrate metabolism regulator) [Agrobacterium vitis]MBE1438951.1 serine kinase of HPr protein (carbohydrate metabolism regulator) [Agrobacterium vitis]